MALDDDVRILSGVRLFESFTHEQLRLLAFGSESIYLPANRKLYREDDEADSAYVVISGRIALYREINGARADMGSVSHGAMLGELALISDTCRLTSAAAELDSEIIRLNRKMFHRILGEYPEVAAKLHEHILADLQDLITRIESMAPRFEK